MLHRVYLCIRGLYPIVYVWAGVSDIDHTAFLPHCCNIGAYSIFAIRGQGFSLLNNYLFNTTNAA